MPRLIVVKGPDVGRAFELREHMTIGREAACAIKLKDEQASRKHARVEVGEGGVTAVDLGSRTGTLINGRKVERATLAHGDALKVGATVFRYEADGDAPPPLPDEPAVEVLYDSGQEEPGEKPTPARGTPKAESPARRPSRPPGTAAATAAPERGRPAGGGGLVRVLVAAAILVLVLFASKWVGEQAVRRMRGERTGEAPGK